MYHKVKTAYAYSKGTLSKQQKPVIIMVELLYEGDFCAAHMNIFQILPFLRHKERVGEGGGDM